MDYTDTGRSMNADSSILLAPEDPGITGLPSPPQQAGVIQDGADAFITANTIWEANNAFNAEQADGTPFSRRGAELMKRLGILLIVLPAAPAL